MRVGGSGAHQVDQPRAYQELVVVMQELPGQGEQQGIVAADLDDRSRAVAAEELLQLLSVGRIEQGREQLLTQGAGMAEQLCARHRLGDGDLMQLGEAEVGDTEVPILGPWQW